MSSSNYHELLHEIASVFEGLAAKLDHSIEAFAQNDDPIDLTPLHRAREVAQRGTRIICNARDGIRSAFD